VRTGIVGASVGVLRRRGSPIGFAFGDTPSPPPRSPQQTPSAQVAQ
jgi:hypothetical protein